MATLKEIGNAVKTAMNVLRGIPSYKRISKIYVLDHYRNKPIPEIAVIEDNVPIPDLIRLTHGIERILQTNVMLNNEVSMRGKKLSLVFNRDRKVRKR